MALLIGGTLAVVFLDLPWSAVVITLLAAVEIFEFRIWRWALQQRPRAGAEGIVGERGVLAGPGRVRIRGSTYPARVLEGRAGDHVVVERVEGMTLVVRRVPPNEPLSGGFAQGV
jgi:membrane protein implicated in regulation of membrane protease activity